MQIAVYSQVLKEKDIFYVKAFFRALHSLGIEAYIYDEYLDQLLQYFNTPIPCLGTFHSHEDFPRDVDFVVTLGGDGTILGVITIVQDIDVPIAGVNLGRLGFLASIEKGRIEEAMKALIEGRYTLDDRTVLHLESSNSIFGDMNFALNDCTILKRDTSSMIIVHTYINGEFLNSYWADGLIVATPTGSTGYSLSCGGPIIFPNSGNFVITPVAPHNLNVRPAVISDNSIISFKIEGRATNFLCTLDSRSKQITSDDRLAVRKADFSIRLVRMFNGNFLSTIRAKLSWGMDSRN